MPIPTEREVHRRSLLRDNVFSTLRQAILQGQLEPGEKLRDGELGEWLGVSRTPIREALLRLEREGLVESRPGKVTMVAPEDPQRIHYARQVAAALHQLAVELSGPSLTPEDVERMRTANEALRSALRTADAPGCVEADDEFHGVIVQRAANPVLIDHLASVTGVLRRTEYLHFGSMTDLASVEQHERIIDALLEDRFAEAAALTRANWSSLQEVIARHSSLDAE